MPRFPQFANGGAICLDETGELPRSLQAKLLHFLQDLECSRVAGSDLLRGDIRIVADTVQQADGVRDQPEPPPTVGPSGPSTAKRGSQRCWPRQSEQAEGRARRPRFLKTKPQVRQRAGCTQSRSGVGDVARREARLEGQRRPARRAALPAPPAKALRLLRAASRAGAG